ncbi:hypothetical protein Pan241w_35780 [Gimesia alba]|uniref:Uncharacterized protein n=1 Tax=Gimesia alba TaxID=2527973 RepID=A0A517RHX6_9PLAN|nr:hypothetical protein [Gimesia alba]QDT43477.1 hypothetical protein Pan241w_35780 [Gimesia alba]
MVQLFYEILWILAALFIVYLFKAKGELGHLPQEVLGHLVVFFVSYSLMLLYRLYSLRKEVSIFLSHHKQIPKNLRELSLGFLRPKMEIFLAQSRSLFNPSKNGGLEVTQDEMEEFVDICFERSTKSYIGSDSNLPSVFMKLYPRYVVTQNKRRHKGNSIDYRFLLIEQASLKGDYESNRSQFMAFYDEHSVANIKLIQTDPYLANDAAKQLKLSSTDFGIFDGSFVIFFHTPNRPEESYRIQLITMDKKNRETLFTFLKGLVKSSHNISVDDKSLTFPPLSKREQQVLDDYFEAIII